MNKTDTLPILKLKEVAALLRCSRQKVYTLADSGELKMVKIGGSSFITQESFDAYVSRVFA